MNILVTATGGAIGQGIIKAIKLSKLKCRIIAVDARPDSAGLYRGDAGYIVPLANEKNFIEEIIQICNKENIDGILIGTDYELLTFAKNKMRIYEDTTAKAIVSPPEIIRLAEDKWLTHKFLVENNLPTIPSTLPENIDEFLETEDFPLIIKPRIGDSSKDTFIVKNKDELNEKIAVFERGATTNIYLPKKSKPIIQKYIPDDTGEYTATTVTFDSRCYGVLAMRREMRFGGHTTKAVITESQKIEKTIKKVAETLNAFGPSNFQFRLDNGVPLIFEINCRFSGTTPLCAEVGFNTVEAVLRHAILNKPVQKLKYKKGIILRYFNEVFVPEEDYKRVTKTGYIKKPHSSVNKFF